jgi:coenzyme F420-0:L-glutamate ligase/coenzyme F420-1:gamma-L-glutamate ligase
MRGRVDLTGRALRTTEVGLADEVAAAASLIQGQSDEGLPVVIVRGLEVPATAGRATDLVRPNKLDLFR